MLKIGPFKPEYQWNRAHRYYGLYRDGEVMRPEMAKTGQSSDHRYSTGIQLYLYVLPGDVIIRMEHSSHAGDELFSCLQMTEDGVKELRDSDTLYVEALTALLRHRLNKGLCGGVINETLARILGVDADVRVPKGW
jgi:hypothetical protein